MIKKKIIINKLKLDFIPVEYRRFIQINLDYSTDSSLIHQDVSKIIPDVSDAIVYINIRVNIDDLPNVNLESIKEACKNAFILRPISPIIIKPTKIRNENINKNSTLEDNAKSFLDNHKPKNKESILQKFLNILTEGE